ncbi:MAG: nitrate reductase [Desulfomonilaceae bacterium]
MYEFVSGPLVWIAFILFITGFGLQFVRVRQVAKKAKVRFGTGDAVHLLQLRLIRDQDGALQPDIRRKYVFSSLLHWLVPFASRNMRMGYEATFVTLAFHVCLLLVPIFLTAHVVMFSFAWGPQWGTLSQRAADCLTVLMMMAVIFFLVRRWMLPEVRFVAFPSDYVVLAVMGSPFVTGFIANRQWFDYETMVVIHMISGALVLTVIPLSRLTHMFFLAFTRAYLGSEYAPATHVREG